MNALNIDTQAASSNGAEGSAARCLLAFAAIMNQVQRQQISCPFIGWTRIRWCHELVGFCAC